MTKEEEISPINNMKLSRKEKDSSLNLIKYLTAELNRISKRIKTKHNSHQHTKNRSMSHSLKTTLIFQIVTSTSCLNLTTTTYPNLTLPKAILLKTAELTKNSTIKTSLNSTPKDNKLHTKSLLLDLTTKIKSLKNSRTHNHNDPF